MKAYEIPYDLKTGNNKQAEIHIGIRLAKFVIYFSGNSFCPRPRAHTRIPILRDWYSYLRNDVLVLPAYQYSISLPASSI